MAHGAMVDSYLRDLLADRFGDDVTVRDSTYVLPLDAVPRLRVVRGERHVLRVETAAAVALDVEPTPELCVALNEINASIPYGRVFLAGDVVIVEHTVEGDELTENALDNAIGFVCWVVDAYGSDLVEDFGGRTIAGFVAGEDAEPDVRDAVEPVTDPDEPAPTRDRCPTGVTAAGYL